jgi:ferredoxin--NADP+ reductase
MKIIEKEILSDNQGIRVIRLKVLAPEIAASVRPGQFVVLMVSEQGERIPLTVVDAAAGSITLIFQEAGFTTRLLAGLNAGDSLYALVGPLGHATEIKNYGAVIIIGGGVGIAEIYPVARALKAAGNRVITIVGARTKDLLILEKELRAVSDEFYLTTDDGTAGRKGFVTDVLKELLVSDPPDLIYAVGPLPMMRRVAQVSGPSGVKTIVSLNALMVDATGMCGCCRVTVGGETKFSCVDGPEFDAQKIDWDELDKRNKIYSAQEKHICKIKI